MGSRSQALILRRRRQTSAGGLRWLISFGLAAGLFGLLLAAPAALAAEEPTVKITSQELLPPHETLRLIWLEIDRAGYNIESINYHPLDSPAASCLQGASFSSFVSGRPFESNEPTLTLSRTIHATYHQLCLEMVISDTGSQAPVKLYAPLQVVKPEIKITDRPTIEITSRQTLSPSRNLIWLEIISNGYQITDTSYYPLDSPPADCRQGLAFSPLLSEDRLAGQQRTNMSLAISAGISWFCTKMNYVDPASGADAQIYLSLPVEKPVEIPTAQFTVPAGLTRPPAMDHSSAPGQPRSEPEQEDDSGSPANAQDISENNGDADDNPANDRNLPTEPATEPEKAESGGNNDIHDAAATEAAPATSTQPEPAITPDNGSSRRPFIWLAIGGALLVLTLLAVRIFRKSQNT